MLFPVLVIHSFCSQYSILLCEHTAAYLLILLLMVVFSLGCYEQRCYKHSCICLLVNICIHFSQYVSRMEVMGPRIVVYLSLVGIPEAFLSSISGLVITDMPILMAYVLVGCCTVLLGPALAILVVTHFHHHSLDSIMRRYGFKEVTGGRR